MTAEDYRSASGIPIVLDSGSSPAQGIPVNRNVTAAVDNAPADYLNVAMKTDNPVASNTRTSKGKRQQRWGK